MITVCLAGSAFLHLLLDALPHYNWIVYLHAFENLPYHWLIREGVCALIVLIPVLYLARRVWPFALLGVVGAMYPDVEKVAAYDLGLPHSLVIFRQHGSHLSTNDYGLPHGALIAGELALTATFLFLVWKTSERKLPATGNINEMERAR